jgi:type VI secretion system secreted protein Hcp
MRFGDIKVRLAAWVLVSAMLPAVPAVAAINAYMTIEGTKQGKIKGDAMAEKISVSAVIHQTKMDGIPDMATGRRQHGSVTITKEIDAASPKLMQAMNTHESLSNVSIVFRSTGAGKSVQTLVLKNAMITAIRLSRHTETIDIEYTTIEVTWTDGGKTATDDWESPS